MQQNVTQNVAILDADKQLCIFSCDVTRLVHILDGKVEPVFGILLVFILWGHREFRSNLIDIS